MPDELTAEAKKEIADAIQIVREDRMDRLIRTRLSNPPAGDPKPPLEGDPKPPTKDGPNPPPPNPNDPPVPPTPGKKGIWWGDAVDE